MKKMKKIARQKVPYREKGTNKVRLYEYAHNEDDDTIYLQCDGEEPEKLYTMDQLKMFIANNGDNSKVENKATRELIAYVEGL